MNRMDLLTARRRETRHDRASAAVAHVLQKARAHGLEITVVGSLARDDFRAHSDVDLLVRGLPDARQRRLVERLVADGMRSSAIPYDLIFEDDLTDDRRQELLRDLL